MLQPMTVREYQKAVLPLKGLDFTTHINYHLLCSKLLYQNNVFNTLFYIEHGFVFPEFAILELGKVKEISSETYHHFGRGILKIESLVKMDQYLGQLISIDGLSLLFHFSYHLLQLLMVVPGSLILLNYRVERISHIVGDCGIYQFEVAVVLLELSVQDEIGLVDKLDHEVLHFQLLLYLKVLILLVIFTYVCIFLGNPLENYLV